MAACDRPIFIAPVNSMNFHEKGGTGAKPVPPAILPKRCLGECQIACRLAAIAVALDVEGHRLPIGQTGQAGALNRRDMHEHVLGTGLGGDKAETFGRIEPFHCAIGHFHIPYQGCRSQDAAARQSCGTIAEPNGNSARNVEMHRPYILNTRLLESRRARKCKNRLILADAAPIAQAACTKNLRC